MTGKMRQARKRSPETELRQLRAEVRRLTQASTAIQRKIHFGNLMSNICFNLAQQVGKPIDQHMAMMMRECQKGWDSK